MPSHRPKQHGAALVYARREEEGAIPHRQDVTVVLVEAQRRYGPISSRLLGRRRCAAARPRRSTGGKAPPRGTYTASLDSSAARGAARTGLVGLCAAAAATTSTSRGCRPRCVLCVAAASAGIGRISSSPSPSKGIPVRPQQLETGVLEPSSLLLWRTEEGKATGQEDEERVGGLWALPLINGRFVCGSVGSVGPALVVSEA